MKPVRRRALTESILLGLSFAGGVLDATSYLAFGKIFTANMTGNTVLLGAALATGVHTHARRAIIALGGYCLGAFVGALLVRAGKRPWPAKAIRTLNLQLLALIALLVLWTVYGVGPVRNELIALGSAVMGLQSAAALGSGVSGVNTTYMTGTLTKALVRLARRLRPGPNPRQGPALGGSAWITYGVGALAGAFAVSSWHSWVLAIPLAVVAAVSVCARRQPQPEEGGAR